MSIDAETAVSHIINSMENSNDNLWTDEDGVTWQVSDNHDGAIVFELTNDDDETVDFQVFRLVKQEPDWS